MRASAAAVVGGVCGAVVAAAALVAGRPSAETPPATDDASARTIAQLQARLERLERAAAQRPRSEAGVAVASTASPTSVPADDAPEHPGRVGPSPAVVDGPADFSKTSTADLSLDADERHARNFDIAGAAKRYRALLDRGGSPAERRHWLIRLGDCLVRLHRDDEAATAYQGCIDASDEDHGERVGCMIWLARRALPTDAAATLRVVDRALLLETGRTNRTVHELGAEAAHALRQPDREIRELTWLVDTLPSDSDVDAWKRRIAALK